MVLLSKFPTDSYIHHILASAKGASHTEHRIFVRTIIRSDSDCMSIFIIPIPCSKIPFVIWIEIQGMQSCQCRGTCPNTVHSISQSADPVFRTVQLASIYGIRTGR